MVIDADCEPWPALWAQREPSGWGCPVVAPLAYQPPRRPVRPPPRDDGESLDALLYRLTVSPPAPARWGVVYDRRLAPVAAPERYAAVDGLIPMGGDRAEAWEVEAEL